MDESVPENKISGFWQNKHLSRFLEFGFFCTFYLWLFPAENPETTFIKVLHFKIRSDIDFYGVYNLAPKCKRVGKHPPKKKFMGISMMLGRVREANDFFSGQNNCISRLEFVEMVRGESSVHFYL